MDNRTSPRELFGADSSKIALDTIAEMEMEHPTYSREEIVRARFTAAQHCYAMDFTSEAGLIECWQIAHVLTSDESWGLGKANYVCEYLQVDVEFFFSELLKNTQLQCDSLTVLSYMIKHIEFIQHRFFIIILRAFIFGFSRTLWCSQTINPRQTAGLLEDACQDLTAVQLCCHTDVIPACVLKTLLEAGRLGTRSSIDAANDDGDTALMMAVFRAHGQFPNKVKHLLDYGANIDVYNICFQNALHMAIAGENLEGLAMLMKSRRERIRCMAAPDSISAFDTSRQIRSALDPDPLHFPDEHHETPLTIAVNYAKINNKSRIEMIAMLIHAGADGDSDIHRETRLVAARKYTPGVLPPCYGLITCVMDHEFVIYLTVQKDTFCMEMKADLNILGCAVDATESILPSSDFDIDKVWISCRNQRFDFAAGVDGMDFDIHFEFMDTDQEEIIIVGCDEEASFKLSLRFPRGPVMDVAWIETVEDAYIFNYSTCVYKGHTLAHHAVLCPHLNLRRKIVGFTSGLCNPLRKCLDGRTAVDTFEDLLAGTTVPWGVKNLLKRMQRNEDWMATYIHKEVKLRHHYSKTLKRIANSRSPFHRLSDDLQRTILSFI